MPRFDLSITNYNKAEAFWEAFPKLVNFDPAVDRIVFMDCSDNPGMELAKCTHFISRLGLDNLDFVFIRRRNWLWNLGGIIDYVRLLAEGVLETPSHAYFMQEHYLNTEKFVANDTIPPGFTIDLDHFHDRLSGRKLALFCSRPGHRVSASVPEAFTGRSYQHYPDPPNVGAVINGKYYCDHFINYDQRQHLPGSVDVGFAIDGANFCVNPIHYIEHYRAGNQQMYVESAGDYGDAHVWDARIGKVMYDCGVAFHDLHRDLCFTTAAELKSAFPNPGQVWLYSYLQPLFFCIHGHDVWKYDFKVIDPYFRYMEYCIGYRKQVSRDIRMACLMDRKGSLRLTKPATTPTPLPSQP